MSARELVEATMLQYVQCKDPRGRGTSSSCLSSFGVCACVPWLFAKVVADDGDILRFT